MTTEPVSKVAIQSKLRTAIKDIRSQLIRRPDISLLDRLMELVQPGFAYDQRGEAILGSILPHIRYVNTRTPKPIAIVLHEIGRALLLYWELERTDECVGLGHLLRRLSDYGQDGIQACELLGGIENGYSLFNRAAQRRSRDNAPSRPPSFRREAEV